MHPGFRTKPSQVLRLGTVSLVLGVVVIACATARRTEEPLELTRPVVERVSEGRVRIRWPAAFTTGPVTIYAGATPETIDRGTPLAQVTGGSVELTTASHPHIDDDYRLYYELVAAASGASIVTAERRLPLWGADNFRDLGGYRTTDGRRVRWGVLYRSNDLASLADRDIDYLSDVGVQLLCDLRSVSEREERPNRVLQTQPPETLEYPIEPIGVSPIRIREAIRTGGIPALNVREMMIAAYQSFVTKTREPWKIVFERLEDPDSLPFLFHCTAGKDRTGFISALVLLALGVPEETVYEDYLATNRYRAAFTNTVLRWAPLYSLFRTRPEDLLPLLDARREYLEASFKQIRDDWGSVDAYLEDALGVTPGRREALRSSLLTARPAI